MKTTTFHNAMVTTVSAYAEALEEMQREITDLRAKLDLVRKASPTTPRLEQAARSVILHAGPEFGHAADDRSWKEVNVELLDSLADALAELDARRGGSP